jgi:DNA-binding transcriptional regulator YhcF (GntR family)
MAYIKKEHTITTLAKRFNVHNATIQRALKSFGLLVTKKKRKRSFTKDELELILPLLEKKLSDNREKMLRGLKNRRIIAVKSQTDELTTNISNNSNGSLSKGKI